MTRFLFYERVEDTIKGSRMVARKAFTLGEEFQQPPTPGLAVGQTLPGPILIEAMAQVAGWLVNLSNDFRCSAIMSMLTDVTLSQVVLPGQWLRIEARVLRMDRRWARCACRASRGGTRVADLGSVLFVLRPIEDAAEVAAETNRFRHFSGWPASRVRAALAGGVA